MDKDGTQRMARLAQLGRARRFSRPRFETLLRSVTDPPPAEVLRRLLSDWSGVALTAADAPRLWEGVLETYGRLRDCMGASVSLQTAILHELHTRRGLLKDPRILSAGDVAALHVDAITDPLTGLYNRRFLREHLAREISRAERMGGIVSVVLMDLQGFKNINDRLGHPVGDSVLMRTAHLIRDSLRAVDAGCRYGGDEFVAVLPNTPLVNSLEVAERIRRRVAGIRLPRRAGVDVGLHYGVASYPTDARTIDFLIKMGDRRLYDCRRHNSNPRARKHPRFAVQGISLRLSRRERGRFRTVEVQDIGYGGLSLVYPGERAPTFLEGDLVQQFSADTSRVSVRSVSVVPMAEGVSRVGCAYVH